MLLPEKPLSSLIQTPLTALPASLKLGCSCKPNPKYNTQARTGQGHRLATCSVLPCFPTKLTLLNHQGKKSGKMLSGSSFRARAGLPKSKPHVSREPAWGSGEPGSGSPMKLGSASSTGLLLARAGPPLPSTDPGRKRSLSVRQARRADAVSRLATAQRDSDAASTQPILKALCPLQEGK